MSSLDLTRDWLRSVLKPYPARERLVTEVMEVLAQRRTLSVKTDAFSQYLPLSLRDTVPSLPYSVVTRRNERLTMCSVR